MKRIIGTVLGAVLMLAGCGGEPTAIETVQSSVLGVVAPPRPYGPLITGNLPGWTTLNTPPLIFTRPNLGYPGWIGSFDPNNYHTPATCPPCPVCPASCMFPKPGQPIDMTTSGLGYGFARFYSIDRRWPLFFYIANSWTNEVPLRTPTPGLPQTGPAYIINDLATTHMNDQNGTPMNGPITQLAEVWLDFYGRVTLCDGPNFTGACRQFGFGCTLGGGVCHGDTPSERDPGHPQAGISMFDLTPYMSPAKLHMSMEVRYGF